jgi:hypothetical protein
LNDLNAQTTKERQGKIIGVGRSVVRFGASAIHDPPPSFIFISSLRRRFPSFVFVRLRSLPPHSKRKLERERKEPLSPISLIRNYHFSIFRRCNFSFGGAPFSRDPAERFDLALPKTKQNKKQNKNNTFYFTLNAKVAIELSTHLLHCNSPVPSRHIQIITALSSYFLASEKKKKMLFFDKLTM